MIAFLGVLALMASAERPLVEIELIGQCEVSHIAVYSSGFAHFEVSNTCGTAPDDFRSGLRKVSASDLQKLKSVIAEAKIESLPKSIEPPRNIVSTEEDVYGIRIWQDGVVKRFSAYALDAAENPDAARRFDLIFHAVEQFGPETK